jgi:outer membrane protein TolC
MSAMSRTAWAAWGCALILTAGCATVRRARDVQAGGHRPPGERTPSAAELGLGTNTVLTLPDALRVALACHPSVAQASQNVAGATAQVRQAGASRWPTASGSAGVTRSSQNTELDRTNGEVGDSYIGSLESGWLLCDFGRTSARVRQSRARLLAAREALRTARNEVALQARTAFYGLCKAQELEQVAAESVRQYREHLEQTRAFVEVGRRVRYDLTKAEVDLGNAELALINARHDVTNARAALHRVLGLAEDPGYRVRAGPPGEPEAPATVDDLMAQARDRHPDLRALRVQEQASSAAVDEAVADLYPELRLSARYGLAGGHFPLVANWSLGIQSALRLFTGWQRTAAIDVAAAQLRVARAKTADREQQVFLALTRAVNEADGARQRLTLTALTARQARENLDVANERFNVGAASSVEQTDAQAALTRALAEQVKARFDYLTALATIRNAVGEE